MIINDLFNNKKFVAEGMSGNVVFSGTGADGGTYEIIQSSPTDFMIHANGRHIDTYGSLQRAMSVLKNEVPGLQQGMAEGRFQDEYPEYGGKDKNKAMTYDRNVGMGYEGEPWSDSNSNWSGDNPTYADSTYEPDTVTLRGSDGTEKEYSPDSPEYQGVLDREYGIQNKLGQIKKAFTQAEKNNPNAKSQQSSTLSPKFDQFKFDVKTGAVIPNTSSNSTARTLTPVPGTQNQPVVPISQIPPSSTAPVAVKPKSGSWQELAKLNNITDPRRLKANTYIKTPDGEEVYVKKGDTLSRLAQRMRNAGTGNRRIKEGNPVPGQNFTTSQGQQMNWNPATKGWASSGPVPGDGFDVVSSIADKRTTQKGDNYNSTYTSTAIAKNPTTGQQQSLAKWDHTDPATGKNYSGTSSIDPQGNATVQKNYDESQGMAEQAPPINVPSGQQATIQPDGSTRISKPGSVSRADYAKNMAAYKAQTQTPEKIADFTQRMASGQGYTDTERQANLQQQQQHFGKYADTGDLDEGDGFDDITTFSDLRTTDQGGKTNQTYTSGTIAKNPTTGQQQSLASWDHTDPKTGKNYSGTNYIDPQGNADVQKNYKESQDQLDELDKKTVASWVRQQPERIKGDTGLSRTNFKKAKRLVDKSIPSAIAKYKDPGYGKQEKRMDEVSVPKKYREKAQVSQAMAQTNKFFGRDDPAAVAAADRTIANRTKGLARADARRRPYTAPPVDQDKQRRDLADKYPNIDELVRQAELRRDPQYDRADGQAYYDGRDAEQNYHKLKQIQRMIRGAELDEMDFGGVGQVTDSDTGDVTTNFNQGPLSVSQTKTPGGYTKQTDQQFNLGTATLGARTVGPNIGAGQLAGTTTKTATNTATGQAKQQVKGVGFGGATGATVGKNYVGSSDDELAKLAADSATGINESLDRMQHLAGIKQSRV